MSPEDWLARIEAEARRRGSSHRNTPGDLQHAIDDIVQCNGRPIATADRVSAGIKRSDAAQTVRALDSAAEWIERSEERLKRSLDRDGNLAEALSRTLICVKERDDPVEPRTSEPPAASAALHGAVATLRDDIATLGRRLQEPSRWLPALEAVERELETLGRRLTDMQAQQAGASDVAALGSILEDLRASIRRSEREAGTAAIPQQLESVSRRLDNLAERPEWAGLARIDERLADLAASVETVVAEGANSAETVATRVDRRLADLAEHFDALARVGATSAQSLADQLHDESTRITGPMRSLSERLADLDRRLETLPSELNRPAKLASERMSKLASRLEALASAAEPLAAIGERMDRRLVGLHEQIEALSVATADRTELQSPPSAEDLAELKAHFSALMATGARPVQTLAEKIERLSGEVGTLSNQVESGPRPVIERLDRVEETLRELGEHADTLPLQLMIRTLQERVDRLGP
ncbi:MAG TPA: hypothetical protein VE644_05835, partial [Gaiellaceae bacterium]|nr:hypothetical protein [Gaiellaceae bacterium]